MTLLEMVQNIASALDTDEISSISDTVESLQIAEIIKETYDEQFNNIMVPELRGLVQLEGLADVNRPNYLRIPENVNKIEWVKYRNYRGGNVLVDVEYIDPDEFLLNQLYVMEGANTRPVLDDSGTTYYIYNNAIPSHYTLFNDQFLVFNSFDEESEATMHASNTLAFGWMTPEFNLEDNFIPHLDANLFPLLLAEAKSTAFINLKQISSSKEEQRARRQRIRMQNDQFKARRAQYDYWNSGPNFARRR